MPKAVGFMQGYFLIFCSVRCLRALWGFGRILHCHQGGPHCKKGKTECTAVAGSYGTAHHPADPDLRRRKRICCCVYSGCHYARSCLRTGYTMVDVLCSCLGSSTTVTICMYARIPTDPEYHTRSILAPPQWLLNWDPVFTAHVLTVQDISGGECKRPTGRGEFSTGELIDKEQLVEVKVDDEKPLWCLLPMIVVILVLNVKRCPRLSPVHGCGRMAVIYDPRKQDLKRYFPAPCLRPSCSDHVCCASGFGGIVSAVPGFQAIVGLDALGTNPRPLFW